MWARSLISFCLSVMVASAIPRPESREVLKSLARLPSPAQPEIIQYHPELGFYLVPEAADVMDEASEVRSKMKGNAQDAELTLQLAETNRRGLRRASASRHFRNAAGQFRARIKTEPTNPKLWLNLAQALTVLGEFDEAAHALSEAKKHGAEEKLLAAANGYFHQISAWRIAQPYVKARGEEDRPLALSLELLPLDELEGMEEHLLAAEADFDRAVSLRSKEAAPYLVRAHFELLKSSLQGAIISMKIASFDQSQRAVPTVAEKPRTDFSKAFELDQSPESLVLAYYLLGAEGLKSKHRWGAPGDVGAKMLKIFVPKLERLAEASDPGEAAVAGECLGILQAWGLRDYRRAAESFRRAAQQAPKRNRAWNLWAEMALWLKDYPLLVQIQEERVGYADNPSNRLALAKAYELTGQTAAAELAVAEAFTLNNNDFYANLAVATALMRRTDGEMYLGQIEAALTRAEKALPTPPDLEASTQLAIAKSIFYGLSGDSKKARDILEKLDAPAEKYPQVREILTELGF